MRRHVSEKQVGLGLSHSMAKQFSSKKSVREFGVHSEVPEDLSNSSKMLKMLRKVSLESQALKGRLSVLQIRQEKQDFKLQLNSKRYHQIQHIREEVERQQQKRDNHLKLLMQKLSQTKQNARLERLNRRNNIMRVQQELRYKNNSEFKKSKERTQDINNRIISERRSEQKAKQQNASQIRVQKKMQKINIQQYLQKKKKGIKQADSSESLRFSRVALEKKQQMEELAALESQMIQRQARSKASGEETEDKIRKLLSSKKSLRTSQTFKLPQLVQESKKEISEKKVVQV